MKTYDPIIHEMVYALSPMASDILLTFVTARLAEGHAVTPDDFKRLVDEAVAVAVSQ